ncbi:TetR/AcrR family transcriptional regulator C-terminal domain-containing protein [Amycolatopsis benzoatilytica]|uniref:TetR/AcrR family transcriptional regulator C-terminal domain-containing protein n=1 Tax=Amycolatopsis benzoatilytica TaxID=346045 RepID=UPI0012B6A55F|nr:TetR/AcrR family transcriptional regulator C-terminal domain-containing protein [Amycolatopsis benzoatilytica]
MCPVKVTRDQIVDRAYELLREAGLSSLSMRRVALDLGVQPGALYYHVANKQELLAVVAARILDGLPGVADDPRGAAEGFRQALLRVRDGAEVVSFVQAYRPDLLVPTHALRRLFAAKFDARHAEWAARTVVHYVLGFVAEEQNHAELVRAGIVEDDRAHSGDSDEAFAFGIDAILSGLSG